MGNHHKKKSPSSLPAKNECIHFESGEAGLPARKGSILHKCFEYGAQGLAIPSSWSQFEEADQKELLDGGVLESDFESIETSDLDGIVWALEEVSSIIQNLFDENRSLAELVGAGELELERMVHVYGSDFAEITFGSLDLGFRTLIVDLKTGEIRNYREQMSAYSLAKMQENPDLESLIVVELYSKKRRSVVYEITLQEAEDLIFELSDRIDAGEEEPNPCSYCNWCKNSQFGACSKIKERAIAVQENRDDFPKDISFRSSELLSTALAALQDFQENPDDEEKKIALDKCAGELSFLWEAAKAATSFLSGVEHSIKSAIESGIKVPGLKTSNRSGKSTITDATEAFRISRLDQESFLGAVSISSTKLAELIGNPATLTSIFEKEGLPIPEEFLGKKKTLLKGNAKKALDHILEKKGILSRGASSISIKADKPGSSLRKGDKIPGGLEK